MKIIGVGDLFVSKRLPEDRYAGFEEVKDLMKKYEVRFGNLETTVHDHEGYPAAYPGGGWAMADPSCLCDIREFGFNALNLANNHAMDYSQAGLLATMKNLKNADLMYFGAGENLSEASLPKYVECREGRAALIGVTSSFHDSDAAGYASGMLRGRPGVSPLRHKEVYEVTPELYENLIKVAEESGINDTFRWSMKNGYMTNTENLFLRNLEFRKGEENRKVSWPLAKDMERIVNSIKEARIQADCVIVSVHHHQMKGDDRTPDDFIADFCHQCIDAGADIIFGHGSHVLRGIEIYKGKPVFYGLGDFILQNEMVTALPYDFYDKYQAEQKDHVGIGMNLRSKNETVGLSANPDAWKSIAAGIDFENGTIKEIILYPLELDYEKGRTVRGWPHLADTSILETIQKISSDKYGTKITITEGTGKIEL